MTSTKIQLRAFLFLFLLLVVSSLGENLLSCESETTSPDASGYHCNENGFQNQCGTFAILRTNSYYSSLSNLSLYLGINRFVIAEANGFSADTDFLPNGQPFLIPIDCKCNNNGGFFGAEVIKTAIKGESFYGIAESLEGLTTCKAIKEKNPSVSPWNLREKVQLSIPLRCACPSSSELSQNLISYPVIEGDTISNLAFKFNITTETIISANNRSGSNFGFSQERVEPFSTLLIPVNGKPFLGPLIKPREPSLGFSTTGVPVVQNPRKKRSKMWMIVLFIALSGVIFGAIIAVGVAFYVIRWKRKKKQNSRNLVDVELQKLSLSVRATCEKKVSFEGSQDTLDGQIIETTHHKMLVEIYTVDDLRKATEDFNSSNLIEESVFHGRLNGKNLAVKRTDTKTVSKIEFGLFHDANHHHPNIIRLMGSCTSTEVPDSFLVFEYAKNGSLKDWLHGGLAMKSQFIASCYCFLTWNQRVKICLDVAAALQYMHQIMTPSYVHRNIKSRNIYLDEEFNAKIGNFGMSKCVEKHTDDVSESYSGSWDKGYLAPEYLHKNVIAPTIDIFAYGVVLLEVLSGKTPITRTNEKEEGTVWLSQKIKLIVESENAEELRDWMDNALGENYSFDGAVLMANLARACVEDDPSLRPSAGEIVDKLSKLVEELPVAEQFSICESSSKPLVKTATNSM